MSMFSNWFIAPTKDAKKIASIILTEKYFFDNWPHETLHGLTELELMPLWSCLRDEPGTLQSISGNLLYKDAEDTLFVTTVIPEFVNSLASLKPAQIKKRAAQWHECEEMTDWNAAEVQKSLKTMVRFAQAAQAANLPIIAMDTV